MPATPPVQKASHPFFEAFATLPSPVLLLDNDGRIVATSAGVAELLSSSEAQTALTGQLLSSVQAQLGAVATAWAYAHSVVRSSPRMDPPALLPVAAGPDRNSQWWQPVLKRVSGNAGALPYWLATAQPTTAAAPAAPEPEFSSEEVTLLRDALAHLPGYVATLRGPEHIVSYAGANVTTLLGQRELLGRSAAAILSATDASGVLRALDHTYQTGRSFVGRELLVPGTEAEPHFLNLSLQPLRDAEHNITGVLVFGQDVTKRVVKPAAPAAPASVQDLAAQLPQITCFSSAEGVIEYFNPMWYAYTGQTADVLTSHDWVDALNADDWGVAIQELPTHLAKGEPWSFAARIRRHDGQYRRHLVHMVPVRNDLGRIVHWFGTMTDIEDIRPDTGEQTQDSFRILADALPQFIWTLKPDGTPDYLNKVAEVYLGLTLQELTQQGGRHLVPEEQYAQLEADLQRNLRSGESWELESQVRRHNGELRWFLHRAQPLRDAAGDVVKWCGTSTDIQNTKQAEQQLQEQIRRNRELDGFVQSAANELRQPIDNLQALFGELRKAVTFHDPDADALLTMVDSSLSRWSSTVRNLVRLVQVQEQQKLPREELSLAKVTREALLELHPHLRATGGEVSTDFQSLPVVSYVRPHLLSILTQLLSNSLRYHDPARPLRLRLESKAGPAGRVQLMVQDNGLGMDLPRQGTRLFQRFHPQATGPGMGLYLVHRIVEANGGRLEVESVPGKGTTFCVTL